MSAIADYAAKQKAHNEAIAGSITILSTAVTGLQGDIKSLNDKITELQTSPGPISPEDQAALDQLQDHGNTLAINLAVLADAAKALDALTPPVVPTPAS